MEELGMAEDHSRSLEAEVCPSLRPPANVLPALGPPALGGGYLDLVAPIEAEFLNHYNSKLEKQKPDATHERS